MKTNEMITNMVQFGDCNKDAYVTIFARDEQGNVVSKLRFPVVATFAHGKTCDIYIEASQGEKCSTL